MIGSIWTMGGTDNVARIYLNDPHQEYTGNLTTKSQSQEVYLAAEVVWDGMNLAQAYCDARGTRQSDDWYHAEAEVERARKVLFPSWPENWDTGVIWQIEGNFNGLSECFDSLAKALDADISGDDDIFDYWPNTMTMLEEFAADLDTLEGSGKDFAAEVYRIYSAVKARFEARERCQENSINFDEEVWKPNG